MEWSPFQTLCSILWQTIPARLVIICQEMCPGDVGERGNGLIDNQPVQVSIERDTSRFAYKQERNRCAL